MISVVFLFVQTAARLVPNERPSTISNLRRFSMLFPIISFFFSVTTAGFARVLTYSHKAGGEKGLKKVMVKWTSSSSPLWYTRHGAELQTEIQSRQGQTVASPLNFILRHALGRACPLAGYKMDTTMVARTT